MTEISNAKWEAFASNLDGKAMMWLGIMGFFMPFMFGGVLIPLLYFEYGLSALIIPLGLILLFVFIAVMMAARQYEKKQRAQLVLGIAAHATRPMRISTAARAVGLGPVTFTRMLSELIMFQVIDLEIFPAFDAFGPKGVDPEVPLPDSQLETGYLMMEGTGWLAALRWIGILGTILSFIVSVVYLSQFILQFLGVL